jgi:hypothetical protein
MAFNPGLLHPIPFRFVGDLDDQLRMCGELIGERLGGVDRQPRASRRRRVVADDVKMCRLGSDCQRISGRLDVVVDAEEVVGVIALLDRTQPFEIATKLLLNDPLVGGFVTGEVQIRPTSAV